MIKVAFVDFWADFKPEESLFWRILSPEFELVLDNDSPDFLFCSTFGEEHLKYDCVKIFYTGENQSPDFNLFDYAMGFDRMDFGDRYLRLPNGRLYEKDWELMSSKHLKAAEAFARKDDFCSFVYSNNLASPERNAILDALSAYRQVSSGGRFRNNVGGPVADKVTFQSRHKFDVAFENCSHPGYCTEKIVQSFAAGTVPIYWGDPTVAMTFNPAAFINCHDFNNFEEVVARVMEVDADDELYLSMLSASALLEDSDSGLRSFLINIFSQNPSAAFRRSREFWGKRYLEKARIRKKIYDSSPRGLMTRLYRHTLWSKRRSGKLLWKIDKMLK